MFTIRSVTMLSPSTERTSGILKPMKDSVSANDSASVRSSVQAGDPPRGSHWSTLERSTGNGNVRTTVVPPIPSTMMLEPAARSTPLTTTRTALAGKCVGAAIREGGGLADGAALTGAVGGGVGAGAPV